MTNPWFILLVGMATVFFALFLIIGFLLKFPWLFRILKRKEHAHPAPLPEIIEVHPAVQPPQEDEDELIAVLTAAVAAGRGTSPGSFAITNVMPAQGAPVPSESTRGFNTPVWGRVERLVRK
ncbi:MAG: OadG family protein [Rectinema sp.]|nr:OadG family protein [Rectinema sp.]